jgi:hypothetical protein
MSTPKELYKQQQSEARKKYKPTKDRKLFFSKLLGSIKYNLEMGLQSISKLSNKIPFIGIGSLMVITNLLVGIFVYFLIAIPLGLIAIPGEPGEWFVTFKRWKAGSGITVSEYAAFEIAYFIAGLMAFFLTYAMYTVDNKQSFITKILVVSIIPIGLFIITKFWPNTIHYIPNNFLLGQLTMVVIAFIYKKISQEKKLATK